MKRKFMVEQPPLADKYSLLIDGGDEKGTHALVTDRDKVLYNLELLDLYGQMKSTVAARREGLTVVFAAGRYVGIVKVDAKLARVRMELFDFRAFWKFRQENGSVLESEYPAYAVNGLSELCSELVGSFSEVEDDRVELVRV